ncbi:hypothetical protein OHAE_1716 [Ochrobactrum soli]|uniref:Uncharacterized protein n=1 Tax=Ochrobactrum soli TaxID=2448455 RepID=A0A2P9HP69_9HYPH|nr:hypothetical protein OHAE_1716 [[Ochrobactrum] soli]
MFLLKPVTAFRRCGADWLLPRWSRPGKFDCSLKDRLLRNSPSAIG